jgi:hypothetical protein
LLDRNCSGLMQTLLLLASEFCFCCLWIVLDSNFEVDYGSEEHATIVYKTLAVDKEVRTDKLILIFFLSFSFTKYLPFMSSFGFLFIGDLWLGIAVAA